VASIWIVKQYGSIPELPGGTRQFDLAESLVRRGHQVTFFLSSFHYLLQEEVRLHTGEPYKVERQGGLNLVWISGFPYKRNDWRRVVNMVDYAKRFYLLGRKITRLNPTVKAPDAVLAFNLPLLTPLFAYVLARGYGASFTLELGDLWPQTLIDMGALRAESLMARVLRSIERSLYKRAQKIITPLPFVSDSPSLISFRDKVVWIGSGINLANYPFPAALPTGKKREFKVIYLGAHGPANDLFNVLNAFWRIQSQGYSNIKLTLIGHGVEKELLIREAKSMKLANVRFEDAIPRNKVPEVVATTDACLFSLKKAAMFNYGINPNKLADYLGSGKPIISAADVRNNIVKEVGCGLAVGAGDPEELANAVIKLYVMSPRERARMGLKGRRYAEQHLDSGRVVDRFVEILGL
jgi:glycosyltransferase involved in cell wall biosynthesis